MHPRRYDLPDLGALRLTGADAVKFLQGQVSNDVDQLAPGHPLLAGYHNPQGRVIALLRLVALAADDILAILPKELAGPVTARLSKFVLRAKVKIIDESDRWTVTGVMGAAPSSGLVVPVDSSRSWLVAKVDAPPLLADHTPGDRDSWRALDIAAGIPQVYAATSEAFVAQMLNLDLLGGIAFDKGCYTGQEIIARAHYRGQVKRRMQRFGLTEERAVAPGDAVRLTDGRAFKVVEWARTVRSLSEFLAVGPVESGSVAAESEDSSSPTLETIPLPLPYALPSGPT